MNGRDDAKINDIKSQLVTMMSSSANPSGEMAETGEMAEKFNNLIEELKKLNALDILLQPTIKTIENIHHRNYFNDTMIPCSLFTYTIAVCRNDSILNSIISSGVNLEKANLKGVSPLMFAINAGNAIALAHLLNNNVSIPQKVTINMPGTFDTVDTGSLMPVSIPTGINPLFHALQRARDTSTNNVFPLLLKHHVDITSKIKDPVLSTNIKKDYASLLEAALAAPIETSVHLSAENLTALMKNGFAFAPEQIKMIEKNYSFSAEQLKRMKEKNRVDPAPYVNALLGSIKFISETNNPHSRLNPNHDGIGQPKHAVSGKHDIVRDMSKLVHSYVASPSKPTSSSTTSHPAGSATSTGSAASAAHPAAMFGAKSSSSDEENKTSDDRKPTHKGK